MPVIKNHYFVAVGRAAFGAAFEAAAGAAAQVLVSPPIPFQVLFPFVNDNKHKKLRKGGVLLRHFTNIANDLGIGEHFSPSLAAYEPKDSYSHQVCKFM